MLFYKWLSSGIVKTMKTSSGQDTLVILWITMVHDMGLRCLIFDLGSIGGLALRTVLDDKRTTHAKHTFA